MKTYSPEAFTPAAAITLATANSNIQPILFTNHFGDKGTYENEDKKTQEVELKWVIKDITVTLTRDWGTSAAVIVLTCELPDNAMFPPQLPDVHLYRGGKYPYLCEEDEIRIYAGYVESSTTPITADLLDEVPFDFEDIETQVTQSHNRNKPLCPIFWGFIDTLKYSGNSNGVTLTIQCRDRTRIFSDTRIVSLKAFQGKTNSDTKVTIQGQVDAQLVSNELSGITSGDRVNILLNLANAAAGNPYGEQNITIPKCWKLINPGLVVRGYTFDNERSIKVEYPQANPAKWVRTATCRIMDTNATPRINIWAERPPIVKGEPTASLQVLDKVPLEVVDFLAKTEERPTDFFASHINGDFVFGPRVKDESGFTDPDRSYRTYFHRFTPDGNYPTDNQKILKIEATRSTLFSFNNFIIVDSSLTKGNASSLYGAVRRGYSASPPHLTERNPSPPCKTQIIYDGGLASYDNPEYGAIVLGLAHARIWSRDIQGVELELVGDPTLYPSEAIRVYNTFLHDYQSYTVVDSEKDKLLYDKFKQEEAVKTANIPIPTQTEKMDTSADNPTSKAIATYLNGESRLPSNIKNLVLPYYSVRIVNHKLTTQGDKGYKTMIMATSDV